MPDSTIDQEQFLRNAMEAHGQTVYRLALCRLQCVPDAEDVYQDVFLRLLGQPAASWDGPHLKAWLIRTTINRCHDLSRFRIRRPTLPIDEIPELATEPQEEWTALWDAVSRLPEKLRLVIHLFYAEDCTTEEIAAWLHCPPATVRSRLHRARLRLKDLLGGNADERECLSESERAHPRPCRFE